MKFTPASSAAWIVRIDCSSAGRLESDIGIPPSPIGNTSASPSLRVVVIWEAYPVSRSSERAPAAAVAAGDVARLLGALGPRGVRDRLGALAQQRLEHRPLRLDLLAGGEQRRVAL